MDKEFDVLCQYFPTFAYELAHCSEKIQKFPGKISKYQTNNINENILLSDTINEIYKLRQLFNK